MWLRQLAQALPQDQYRRVNRKAVNALFLEHKRVRLRRVMQGNQF